MSTAVMTNRFELNSVADTVLKTAAGFWFVVAVIGQWAFLYYLVTFYGPSTLTGNFQAWTRNTFLRMSYVRGDTAGNLAFAAHALLASVIAFGRIADGRCARILWRMRNGSRASGSSRG